MARKAKQVRRRKGEGTIYRRQNGGWAAQITIYDPVLKQNIRKTVYASSESEVLQKKRDLEARIHGKKYTQPNKITVEMWINDWLDTWQLPPTVSPSVADQRRRLARIHIIPEIGHIRLQDLRAGDVQRLYNEKLKNGRMDGSGGLSTQSVRHIHNLMYGAMKRAVKDCLIERNIIEDTQPPTVEKQREIKPLTEQEVVMLLSVLEGERYAVLFKLELSIGLRKGEIIGLRWQDIDLNTGELRVRQQIQRISNLDGTGQVKAVPHLKTTKSRRTILLSQNMIALLRKHKALQNQEKLLMGPEYQDHGLVFATCIGTPVTPRRVNTICTRLFAKAKLEHRTFHDLRHTVATLILARTSDMKMVQELLGHSDIRMTMDIYGHVLQEQRLRAVETMDRILFQESKEKSQTITLPNEFISST